MTIVPQAGALQRFYTKRTMNRQPDIALNLRRQLRARPWLDRAVILGFAVLTGLAVVAFTELADAALALNHAWGERWAYGPLLWTPTLTVALVWAVRRWAPAAAGSGVPQTLCALECPREQRSQFVSLRLSIAKALGVCGALLAGLSVGRQGPSVQVGAGVMLSARRWLSPRSGVSDRELVVAGGAAGLAAAFNTPLGGLVFAFEQLLSRRLEQRSSGLMLAVIVIAGLVAVSALGNLSAFGRVRSDGLHWWSLLGPGLLIALLAGGLGGLMSRLLLASFTGLPDRVSGWRQRYPLRFAAVCGLVVGAIAIVTGGQTVGIGHQHTQALLAQAPTEEHLFGLFTGLKMVATWLSLWCGVPAGLFGPGLSMGAGLGADVAWLLDSPHHAALIALGMCAMLAALTQLPITSMIIVMEMTDGHSMVLSLMACALLANGVSRLMSRPLYAAQTEHMLKAAQPSAPR